MNNTSPKISVVIPCYKSKHSIEKLIEKLTETLKSLTENYEIILVNDASPDGTLEILKQLPSKYPNVIVIDLMFNVGQFRALMCGLEHSQGEFVITMDDDLQHRPDEIPKLYERLKSSPDLDAVIGKYKDKKHNAVRNIGSFLIYKLNSTISKTNPNVKSTSFRCLRRPLVNTVIANKTLFPVIGPLVLKSSHRIINIEVSHDARVGGKSNYNLIRLIKTTLDNLFNFSSLPLKYISILGTTIFVISFFIAAYYLIKHLIGEITVPGWTTTIIFLNIYSGLILLSIGIVGEYILRIVQEVKKQPVYKIREIIESK